jgi:hypothetical protein
VATFFVELQLLIDANREKPTFGDVEEQLMKLVDVDKGEQEEINDRMRPPTEAEDLEMAEDEDSDTEQEKRQKQSKSNKRKHRIRSRNAFIDAHLDGDDEETLDDYADLEDWIVCKRGRTYAQE